MSISNTVALASTAGRAAVLGIAEAAYAAIDTGAVVRRNLVLEGTTLNVHGMSYDLAAYKRVRVIGCGKASCRAIAEIESILRSKITDGIGIDVRAGTCDISEVVQGTHPRPSAENVVASKRIVDMAEDSTADDLVIVAVSGGGSALLCWPMDECEQGARLYDDFLHTGATIQEMNAVRKHLSSVKGGGLAALLYPATVVALVFCDVPGDHFDEVASGPTYLDKSTIADAQKILDHYGLSGYVLRETPKDLAVFEKVQNVPAVSNTTALEAMRAEAERRGYRVVSLGDDCYDEPHALIARMRAQAAPHTAVIAAGEPRLVVTKKGGKGGRCQYAAIAALDEITDTQTFLAFASDGRDNSDSAGALADTALRAHALEAGLSAQAALESFDTYSFCEAAGSMLMTGPTDANVSDLFVLLTD